MHWSTIRPVLPVARVLSTVGVAVSVGVVAAGAHLLLEILGEGLELVIAPPPGAVEQMQDVVRQMHTSSGLLSELGHGLSMDDAQRHVLDYVRGFVPEPCKPRWPATRSARTAPSWPGTCPRWTATCATGSSTSRASRSSPAASTRAPTSPRRRRQGATGRWPTSRRASESCGTTARPSSCPLPDRTPTPLGGCCPARGTPRGLIGMLYALPRALRSSRTWWV